MINVINQWVIQMAFPDASIAQLLEAQRQAACASLAAGIIAASGRPWSVQQALELESDIYFTRYPVQGSGRYQAWMQERDNRLSKIHGPNG